jgi:hypothetical protein
MRRLTVIGFALGLLAAGIGPSPSLFASVARAPSNQAMRQDDQWVELFFQDYAAAFRSKSRDRLLAKFCLPLTFLTRSGPIVFDQEANLSSNLDALMRRYERIGAVDWKYTIKGVRTIGSGISLVEIEWRFFNAGNELLYSCDTSYFLAGEAKGGAKIMAVIAHNETERYEQALKRKGEGK